MVFPSTSLIKSEIDSALFFHKKYKKFGTKMIAIMPIIKPEIPLSFSSAMILSERAPSMTYPIYSVPYATDTNNWATKLTL